MRSIAASRFSATAPGASMAMLRRCTSRSSAGPIVGVYDEHMFDSRGRRPGAALSERQPARLGAGAVGATRLGLIHSGARALNCSDSVIAAVAAFRR
jgi:hypothetical protein